MRRRARCALAAALLVASLGAVLLTLRHARGDGYYLPRRVLLAAAAAVAAGGPGGSDEYGGGGGASLPGVECREER